MTVNIGKELASWILATAVVILVVTALEVFDVVQNRDRFNTTVGLVLAFTSTAMALWLWVHRNDFAPERMRIGWTAVAFLAGVATPSLVDDRAAQLDCIALGLVSAWVCWRCIWLAPQTGISREVAVKIVVKTGRAVVVVAVVGAFSMGAFSLWKDFRDDRRDKIWAEAEIARWNESNAQLEVDETFDEFKARERRERRERIKLLPVRRVPGQPEN